MSSREDETASPSAPIHPELELSIGMLRQWLNEDRIKDGSKMVSNEDIHDWIDKGLQAFVEQRCNEARIDELQTLWPKFTDIQINGTNGLENNPTARKYIDDHIAALTPSDTKEQNDQPF